MTTQQKHLECGERIVPGSLRWEVGYPDHIQRYRFAERYIRDGMTVLDAACGCGYGAAHLADAGAGKVIGCDLSSDALQVAQEQFSRENILWVKDDCHDLSSVALSSPFDLIVCFEAIEHLNRPDEFVRRAAKLLAPSGKLILSTPNRLWLNARQRRPLDAAPTNPFHVTEFTEVEFRKLLALCFHDVDLWYQCNLAEGTGLEALVQVIQVVWRNPFVRAGRWLQRVIRNRSVSSTDIDFIGALTRDWRICADHPGPDRVAMLIAVCSQHICASEFSEADSL